ncbi:MAG: hypothetical protein ACRERX_16200 [Pseudomonas sp.]
MRTFLAVFLLILTTTVHAAFPKDDSVIYEGAKVLSVSTPNEQYVLVYPCESCTPIKMQLNGSSVIKINGSLADIDTLMNQASWRADVFAEGATPDVVSRISTY